MDLLAIAIATGAAAPILVGLETSEAARLPLGLPLILFFPGYSLVAALFPSQRDLAGPTRLVLSLGASLAIVPLIGLALNSSPWGVRPESSVAFLSPLVISACALGLWRRYRLPAQERFKLEWQALLTLWHRHRWYDKLLGLALLAATAVAATAVAILFLGRQGEGEAFSEFYLLGAQGRLEGYPSVLPVGDSTSVRLGIINHERREVAYRLEVRVDGLPLHTIDDIRLADGGRWEASVPFALSKAGQKQRVEFLLYREGESLPYRWLRLWVAAAEG